MTSKNPIAVMETTQGTIKIQLMPNVAPKATENFVKLSEKGYYNDLTFHRIIKGFMIQGGDPTGTGRGGSSIWGAPFEDEVNVDVTFDKGGYLAMANAGPNSNGSQFFITTVPTPWLNRKHTIFGKVIEGQDIVKKLEAVKTGPGDRPSEVQKITRITIENGESK
jgi:peptidylprolyl isomerase